MNSRTHHSTAASEWVVQGLRHTVSPAPRATGGQIPEQVRGPSSAPRRAPVTRHFAAAALAIAAALALAGCDYFVGTSVQDILASPLKYEGQEVRLKGTVTDVTQLPLLDTKAYTLQDGNSKIVVIVTQGQLPAVKDTVKLKGTVKSTMIVNGKAVGQRVEETQRLR